MSQVVPAANDIYQEGGGKKVALFLIDAVGSDVVTSGAWGCAEEEETRTERRGVALRHDSHGICAHSARLHAFEQGSCRATVQNGIR